MMKHPYRSTQYESLLQHDPRRVRISCASPFRNRRQAVTPAATRIACLVALLLGLILPSGCNSPTLPLPPPSSGSIEAVLDSSNHRVQVTGSKKSVEPHALVMCFNNRTGIGTVVSADANGAFNAQIEGASGDTIEIWQRFGNAPPSVSLAVK